MPIYLVYDELIAGELFSSLQYFQLCESESGNVDKDEKGWDRIHPDVADVTMICGVRILRLQRRALL